MVYYSAPLPVTTTVPAVAAPKEGWKTTEFWLTVASQLVAVLVFVKALPSTDADKLRVGLDQFIPAAAVALASGAGLVAYIVGRFKLKAQPAVIVPVPVTPAPLPQPPVFTPPTPEPVAPPTSVLPPAPAPSVLPDKPPTPTWIPDRTGEVLR